MEQKQLRTYEHIIGCDTETPITLYTKYVNNNIGFLLESKEQPKGRYSFMATNPDVIIEAYNEDIIITENGVKKEKKGKALDLIKEMIEGVNVTNKTELPFVGGAVGSVAYDVIKQYESLPMETIDYIKTPDIHLMFVTEVLAFDHLYNRVHIVILEEATELGAQRAKERIKSIQQRIDKSIIMDKILIEKPLVFQSNITKKAYTERVEKAKKYIYDGDIFQVVLSQRWSAKCDTPPFTLYRKLRQVNPSPYMFYFNLGEYHIVGASPEMLVELKDNKVKNCPIAGTRKRGKNAEEDKILAEDLLSDLKERAEHNMLVDLGRNDMGRIAKIGSVKLTKYMKVQNYSHVMHLVSLVEGDKEEGKDMFEILMSFLPAGTLSGAPKIRAMEIIEELESSKRGIYGGAIGYFGYNNNMDMCIAIRTMVIKDQVVHIQAGGGIVADSDPLKEYEETLNKAEALMTAINLENMNL